MIVRHFAFAISFQSVAKGNDQRLILLCLIREVSTLDVSDITSDRIHHDGIEICITTQELRLEAIVLSQHVVDDEHLTDVRLLAVELLAELFVEVSALLVIEVSRQVADWAFLVVHLQAGDGLALAIDGEFMGQVLD